MTAPFKVGALTCRPFVRNGVETGQWQVDLPARLAFNGKRMRYLTETKQAAEAQAQALLQEIRHRGAALGAGRDLSQPSVPEVSIGEAIRLWISVQDLRVQNGKKKHSSLETNINQLKAIDGMFGALPLGRLTVLHLEEYQAFRKKAGRSSPTINSELATFYQVQKLAQKRGSIPVVVSTDPVPVYRRPSVVIEPQQAMQILENLPEQKKVFVRFLMETGCRFGEAANLRWRDIDLTNRTAQVRRQEVWTPKTKHSVRPLHLSPDLNVAIADLPRTEEFVFAGRKSGRPIDDIRRSFGTAVEAAGIVRPDGAMNITPKTLRSSFATWIARGGTR